MVNYKEAAQILEQQKNKFLDEWVDYGGVAKAYDLAIDALNKQDGIEPVGVYDNGDWDCGNCGYENPHGNIYCGNCGRLKKGVK